VQHLALRVEGPGALQVDGTLGLPLDGARLADATAWLAAPLALTVVSRELELGFLSGLHPLVRLVGGRLTVEGAVGGSLGAPRPTGSARWTQGRLALFGFGEYRDVEAEVTATGERVDLTRLELKAGGGEARLVGHLVRTGEGQYHLTAEGSAEKLPLVVDDQLLITASLALTAEGELGPTLLDLTRVDVPRAKVELPEVGRRTLQALDRPQDILVLASGRRAARRQREAVRAASGPPPQEFGLRAVIDAPRNLWVHGADLDVELGLSEAFRLERRGAPQVFGEARFLRGSLSVIGRKFVVQPGASVRFAGAAEQPIVNLAAQHTNDKEQVKVTVAVTGRGTDLALKATSEPPMPETEIYTLLATGRRELKRGSGASLTADDALSVVGQLATSQLRTLLANKVPIDVLSFESSDNFARVKFDVGKYLSDWLYLGVSAQTGANVYRGENPWAARLEFRLSRRWSLEAYAGTAPAGGADLVWSQDF
jgi:translocation and assembly module TamB